MENHKKFEKLLKKNQRYIHKIAASLGADEYREDLIAVGNMAFYKCYTDYDSTLGTPFIQYAGKYIRFEMMKFLNANGRTIRIPQYGQKLIKNGKLQRLQKLEGIKNEDGETTLAVDLLASPTEIEPDERIAPLLNAVSKLKPKHKMIIEMYYGLNSNDPMTYLQIAKLLNTTKQNISLHLLNAEKKLKTILNEPTTKTK